MSSLDVSALERSLALLNILLDWAIAFVVVGLILEYSPKFWSRLSCIFSHRFIEKTGEVLVILGVAGELGMHIWSAHFEDKIKSAQRDKIIALETRLAPRSLTAEQQAKVLAKIRCAKAIPFVLSLFNEPEVVALVEKLEPILKSANWIEREWPAGDIKWTRPNQPALGLNSIPGLYVQVDESSAKELGGAAISLAEALKAEGIEAVSQIGKMPEGMDKTAIQIQVGKKS